MRKYDFFMDPGHGWLKVKRTELIDLGIEDKISSYSYQRGDYIYLEEDRDVDLFLEAWERREKCKFVNDDMRQHIADRRSRIRSYESFVPVL